MKTDSSITDKIDKVNTSVISPKDSIETFILKYLNNNLEYFCLLDKVEYPQDHLADKYDNIIPVSKSITTNVFLEIIRRKNLSLKKKKFKIEPIVKFKWVYNLELMTFDEIIVLREETRIIKSCNHENIHQLDTFLYEKNSLVIFTDSFNYGTCESALKFVFTDGMNYNQATYVIRGVLNGLYYLKKKCKLVHGDIRGSNILIDASGEVKLFNFRFCSFARKINDIYSLDLNHNGENLKFYDSCGDVQCESTYICLDTPNNLRASLPWKAPEVFLQNNCGYCFKSDIYSAGITILELIFGAVPFKNMHPLEALNIKTLLESSDYAKAICIFTNKYFSKKNVAVFFQQFKDHNKTEIIIDYGYIKVFNSYINKTSGIHSKLYQLVKTMLYSNPNQRSNVEDLLKNKLFEKLSNDTLFMELK